MVRLGDRGEGPAGSGEVRVDARLVHIHDVIEARRQVREAVDTIGVRHIGRNERIHARIDDAVAVRVLVEPNRDAADGQVAQAAVIRTVVALVLEDQVADAACTRGLVAEVRGQVPLVQGQGYRVHVVEGCVRVAGLGVARGRGPVVDLDYIRGWCQPRKQVVAVRVGCGRSQQSRPIRRVQVDGHARDAFFPGILRPVAVPVTEDRVTDLSARDGDTRLRAGRDGHAVLRHAVGVAVLTRRRRACDLRAESDGELAAAVDRGRH